MDDEKDIPPVHTVNIDSLDTSASISSLHQEGNFLVGVTDKGIRFRQSIPVNKILNKNEKGDWILQERVVV